MSDASRTPAFFASFPYEVVVDPKKGKRKAVLARSTHMGEMPVVAADAAVPLFDLWRGQNAGPARIEERVLGWDGGCWTPIRDSDGTRLTFEDFNSVQVGRRSGFDPFSSPYLWHSSRALDPKRPAAAQVRALPEYPVVRGMTVVSNEEDKARAHATRISQRLALIGGHVYMRVPAPIWHLLPDGDAVPLWAPPPFEVRTHRTTSVDRHFIDGRFEAIRHMPANGLFVSWTKIDRFHAATDLKSNGIEILDREAATAVTVPDADMALAANLIAEAFIRHFGKQPDWAEDDVVEMWLDARNALRRSSMEFFGNPSDARETFEVIAKIVERATERNAPWLRRSIGPVCMTQLDTGS